MYPQNQTHLVLASGPWTIEVKAYDAEHLPVPASLTTKIVVP